MISYGDMVTQKSADSPHYTYLIDSTLCSKPTALIMTVNTSLYFQIFTLYKAMRTMYSHPLHFWDNHVHISELKYVQLPKLYRTILRYELALCLQMTKDRLSIGLIYSYRCQTLNCITAFSQI